MGGCVSFRLVESMKSAPPCCKESIHMVPEGEDSMTERRFGVLKQGPSRGLRAASVGR